MLLLQPMDLWTLIISHVFQTANFPKGHLLPPAPMGGWISRYSDPGTFCPPQNREQGTDFFSDSHDHFWGMSGKVHTVTTKELRPARSVLNDHWMILADVFTRSLVILSSVSCRGYKIGPICVSVCLSVWVYSGYIIHHICWKDFLFGIVTRRARRGRGVNAQVFLAFILPVSICMFRYRMALETTWHEKCDYVTCIFIWESNIFVTLEKLD